MQGGCIYPLLYIQHRTAQLAGRIFHAPRGASRGVGKRRRSIDLFPSGVGAEGARALRQVFYELCCAAASESFSSDAPENPMYNAASAEMRESAGVRLLGVWPQLDAITSSSSRWVPRVWCIACGLCGSNHNTLTRICIRAGEWGEDLQTTLSDKHASSFIFSHFQQKITGFTESIEVFFCKNIWRDVIENYFKASSSSSVCFLLALNAPMTATEGLTRVIVILCWYAGNIIKFINLKPFKKKKEHYTHGINFFLVLNFEWKMENNSYYSLQLIKSHHPNYTVFWQTTIIKNVAVKDHISPAFLLAIKKLRYFNAGINCEKCDVG